MNDGLQRTATAPAPTDDIDTMPVGHGMKKTPVGHGVEKAPGDGSQQGEVRNPAPSGRIRHGRDHMEAVHAALMAGPAAMRVGELARETGLTPQDAHRALSRLIGEKRAVRLARGIYTASDRASSIRDKVDACGDAEPASAGLAQDLAAIPGEAGRAMQLALRQINQHLMRPLTREETETTMAEEPLARHLVQLMIARREIHLHAVPAGMLLMLRQHRLAGSAAKRQALDQAFVARLAPWPAVTSLSCLVPAVDRESSGAICRSRLQRMLLRLERQGRIETLSIPGRDLLVRRSRQPDRPPEEGRLPAESVFPAVLSCRDGAPLEHGDGIGGLASFLTRAYRIMAILAELGDVELATLRSRTGEYLMGGSGILRRLERSGLTSRKLRTWRLTEQGRVCLRWLEDLSFADTVGAR